MANYGVICDVVSYFFVLLQVGNGYYYPLTLIKWLMEENICPECGSPNLQWYEDGTVECLDCGFVFNP